MKDCLSVAGYMSYSGYGIYSWASCLRRNWCNGGFRASLPEALISCFKEFTTTYPLYYNYAVLRTVQDYFALPAAAEVFKGDSTYGQGGTAGVATAFSNLAEFNALTQFDWYSSSSHRMKVRSGSYTNWRNRSVLYDSNQSCGYVNTGGEAAGVNYETVMGISPFGCM